VTLSTCAAEYIAAATAADEAAYFKQLLEYCGYQDVTPIPLLVDNESALRVIRSPVINDKARTIAARYHFVREQECRLKEIKVDYVGTKLQLADNILMKGLPSAACQHIADLLGMKGVGMVQFGPWQQGKCCMEQVKHW
jgi:hypothetical protein